MLFIYLFLSFQCMVSHGIPTNKRLNHVESRLNHLEIRLNFGLEDLASLKETMQVFNDALIEALGNVYTANNCGEGELKNALAIEVEENPTGKLKEVVLQALREEKMWTRIQIGGLTNRADRLDMDFGDLQKDVNATLDAYDVRVEALERRLGALIKDEISNLNTILIHAIDDINVKMKYIQSSANQNQQDIEAAREEINNFNKQSSQISRLLTNLEANIYDKLELKMQTELDGRMSCPPDWRQFTGYCYKLYTNAVDFETANLSCSVGNAFIVDIQSEDENVYLNNLSGKMIWIGITDRENEGEWVSLRNGKQLVYSNWATNQPQNFAEYDEDCAVMSTGDLKWHDYKCDKHKFRFVCKKMVT